MATTNEQLFRAMVRGVLTTLAQSDSNQFAGITTVLSGQSTQVVSTTSVKSDSIILHSVMTTINSNQRINYNVSSRADGAYFSAQPGFNVVTVRVSGVDGGDSPLPQEVLGDRGSHFRY